MSLASHLKYRNAILAGAVGVFALLGVFVNALFLLVAVLGLCPLMHVFGGHGHGASSHTHDPENDEKEHRWNDV